MDWLDLLAVQGTLKSLLQHHNNALVSSNKLANQSETNDQKNKK